MTDGQWLAWALSVGNVWGCLCFHQPGYRVLYLMPMRPLWVH